MENAEGVAPEAAHALAARMTEALDTPSTLSTFRTGAILRFSVPVTGLRPLPWLRRQRGGATQYYWRERNGDFEMAGVGEADILTPTGPTDLGALFTYMRTRLSPRFPGLRYYGGFRFGGDEDVGARWQAFKAYRFVIPRFEVLHRSSGGTALACNIKIGGTKSSNRHAIEKALSELEVLSLEEDTSAAKIPPVLRRDNLPNESDWTALVEKALDAFMRHDIEKVVLARETTFTASENFDPVALLEQLLDYSTKSFAFCFHPGSDRAFIGASPELLFKRTNCFLESEALAGTRPRGASDEEDRQLGEALFNSDKELREHRFVVRTLREHFQRLCRHTEEEERPSLLRLRNCQHLYTRMSGILSEAESDSDATLIETLHPTPAVGGLPSVSACAWLKEYEPFDRGIYAAPVGWVGYDSAGFCVAIRSGLVNGKELSLYCGAGIVPGSRPDEEWDEIEHKMGNFLQILSYES